LPHSASLTTLLTVARTQGYVMTVIAFALNLLVVWAVLSWAPLVGRVLGDAGSRAIAKVFNLVLAAIAVTFIRQGLIAGLAHGRIRSPSG
jgi:small neutral amino acid transporter SnatA (MarC family)